MRVPDLITVGEAFEDLVFLGLDRLPAAGEEIKTSRFTRTVGGGAVITAVAAARLGLSCRVLTGLDDAGAVRVTREGVQVTNLRRPGEPHAISAALSTRRDRSFVTFTGVNDVLEERLLAGLSALRARHVHFALQPSDCRPWLVAVRALGARGITCSWDFGWSRRLLRDRAFPQLAAAVNILFLNELEAMLYARRRTLATALDGWRSSAAEVIVKLGSKGSCLLSPSATLRVKAPRVRAIDTTGAGDAFNGGFLYARLRGAADANALRIGSLVGSLSTRAAGGLEALPTAADLASA